MKSRVLAKAAGLALAAVIAVAAHGCSKNSGLHTFIPNQRPTVSLTSAPVNTLDSVSYSVHIMWSGDDPDGRVDHYEFAIDAGDVDTAWVVTRKNAMDTTFTSRTPLAPGRPVDPWRGFSPHTFVIRAVDNLGLASARASRSFFSTTVAPTVQITSPRPSIYLARMLTPALTINWVGTDPDGYLAGVAKPLYYKWKVFELGGTNYDWTVHPDSLRRLYAKTNFAEWDSVGGNTTSLALHKTAGQQYVFAIVSFDTAGAYSPVFSMSGNMLWFEVGFAATLGPRITAFNGSFFWSMVSGGYTPNDPISWVHLELPAANRVTFNWFADPPSGSAMQAYRWRLDGDVGDDTPRTNESTDWYHWSAPAVGTTSCTIGPFTPGIQVFLYIEAEDNNGLKSLLTIVLHPVQPTFAHDLLVVDDTRPEVDQYTSAGRLLPYATSWPARAELDTFLFARGGYPWRGTQVPATTVPQPVSSPGLFAGYKFDTLGSRVGLKIAANGTPLRTLGQYKHVVWMVDRNGATNSGSPIDPVKPMCTLHYMCTPNNLNTLGSYISSGGSVWLVGGDAAYASLREFNAKNPSNDLTYGPGITVFSNGRNELVPGRLMYDSAHWQTEMACEQVSATGQLIVASVPKYGRKPWTSTGWNYRRPVSSPDYTRLPAQMRRKALALGDSLPPTRLNSGQFYQPTGTFDVEYMTQPSYVIEDDDSLPFTVTEKSALDTLMDAKGFSLAQSGNEAVTMTYYHGHETPDFIFSGFNFWMWTRADDKAIVDFVLQNIWNLSYTPPAPRPSLPGGARPLAQSPTKPRPVPVPNAAVSRLPNARTAGR